MKHINQTKSEWEQEKFFVSLERALPFLTVPAIQGVMRVLGTELNIREKQADLARVQSMMTTDLWTLANIIDKKKNNEQG